jgi:hypothetical protein
MVVRWVLTGPSAPIGVEFGCTSSNVRLCEGDLCAPELPIGKCVGLGVGAGVGFFEGALLGLELAAGVG